MPVAIWKRDWISKPVTANQLNYVLICFSSWTYIVVLNLAHNWHTGSAKTPAKPWFSTDWQSVHRCRAYSRIDQAHKIKHTRGTPNTVTRTRANRK